MSVSLRKILTCSVLFLNKMNLLCLKEIYTDVPCELTGSFKNSCSTAHSFFLNVFVIKVGLSPSKKNCLICFNESPLKLMKNVYLILKVNFVLKIYKFLSWLLGHVEETAYLERQSQCQNLWRHSLVNTHYNTHCPVSYKVKATRQWNLVR